MPNFSHTNMSQVSNEPSTKNVKLTVPKSIFDSDVGKVIKVLLLVAELVGFFVIEIFEAF